MDAARKGSRGGESFFGHTVCVSMGGTSSQRAAGRRPDELGETGRSMLPPDTMATTLPWPARPLHAAAMAHPAAPSAITCTRSAAWRIAPVTSRERHHQRLVDHGPQQRPHARQHRLATGAIDERRGPALEVARLAAGQRGGQRRRRLRLGREHPHTGLHRPHHRAHAGDQAAAAEREPRPRPRPAGPRGFRGPRSRCQR